MMNALIALGLGIVVFALIVGVGIVVMQNFGGAVAVCPPTNGYSYNSTSNTCSNSSGSTSTPTGGWATTNTLVGYLSTNLVTWVPAVIALGVGLLFIGALMGKKATTY